MTWTPSKSSFAMELDVLSGYIILYFSKVVLNDSTSPNEPFRMRIFHGK